MSSSEGAGASGPAFVLVNPQMGENIGAAMRVMANFGLDDLRIHAPRDGWPNERAEAMSAGSPLYTSARVSDDLDDALDGCTVLYATTARPRGMVKPVMTAREAMAEARGLIAAGQKPGFLFGAEKSGLPNELVARSRAILTLPVDPGFASLNLAMAVGVLAHEWRAGDPPPQEFKPLEEAADAVALHRMYEHFEDELERAGFFFPLEKKPLMTQNLRNMFARAGLTEQEVRTFRGAIKALTIGRGKARVMRE